MRIAFVCLDPGVPVFGHKGSSVHCQEMIRQFLDHGFQVSVFAIRTGHSAPDLSDQVEVIRWADALPRESIAREQSLQNQNGRLLLALEHHGPFDLVYERHALWSHAAMTYARRHDIPGIVEVNSPLIEEQQAYRTLHAADMARDSRRRCFRDATSIITVSDQVAQAIEWEDGADRKVVSVANGVALDRFRPRDVEVDPAPRRDGRPQPVTVGFVGSFKPWHGVRQLLLAFAIARRSRLDLRLVLAGDGPERDTLLALTERFPPSVRGGIEWPGQVPHDRIPHLMRQFDIAAAPYPHLESFYFSPLKILEAMATGLPTVASRIGQIPALIPNGECGLLVQPGCVHSLAEAILRLAHSPDLRTELGTRARAKAVREHSWSRVFERILATVPITSARPPRVPVR